MAFASWLVGDAREALGALWTGYVVLLHATAYASGVLLLLPMVPRARPALRASLHAALLAGTLLVSALCFLPIGWWAWLLPAPLATPLFWLGAAGVTARVGPGVPTGSVVATAASLLLALWIAGALVSIARLALGWITMAIIARGAVRAVDAEWARTLRDACVTMDTGQVVALRFSHSLATPVVWGVLDPVVLLPQAAHAWPAEQRRMVLLHELAHVRRGDILLATLSAVSRALYWFHPIVRWSASTLRVAREEACDLAVVESGVRRSAYAECLLRVADESGGLLCIGGRMPRLVAPVAVGMAGSRGIDARLRRLLMAGGDSRSASALTPATVPRVTRAALVTCVLWAAVVGTVRLAPQRRLAVAALSSADEGTRAYGVLLLGRTRRASERATIRERAHRDPSPTVRALARTRPTLQR